MILKIPPGGIGSSIRGSGVASDWAVMKHQGGRGKGVEKDGQRDKENELSKL